MSLQGTELYDEDTDTYYADETTYCKHGTYIGTPGGPDIMCGACEMGEPDPTINEYKGLIANRVSRIVEKWQFFTEYTLEHPEAVSANVALIVWNHNIEEPLRQISGYLATIKEMRQFVTSDDDDNWLERAHRYFTEEEK